MNIDFIPFQIGEQYENWEFDLEPDFGSKHLEKYRYIANDITDLFKIPIHEIYLYFNLDILYQVEYIFDFKQLHKLKSELIDKLSTGTFKDLEDRLEWENTIILVILEKRKMAKYVHLYIVEKDFHYD